MAAPGGDPAAGAEGPAPRSRYMDFVHAVNAQAPIVAQMIGARSAAEEPFDADLPDDATPAQRGAGRQLTDVEQVRAHQVEILSSMFPAGLLVFTVLLTMLSLCLFGMLCWLIIAFAKDFSNPCDTPLHVWTIVDFATTAYHAVHACALQVKYSNPEAPGAPVGIPRWERLHLFVVAGLDIAWQITGLVWVATAETCPETSPSLFVSVKAYILTSMVESTFTFINLVGLYTIMAYLLRHGALGRSKSAAPVGTLDRFDVVRFDPSAQVFRDHPECCICLASFNERTKARRTPCSHVFHSRCLSNWLKVSHTCPLCRSNLVIAVVHDPPGGADPQRQLRQESPPPQLG